MNNPMEIFKVFIIALIIGDVYFLVSIVFLWLPLDVAFTVGIITFILCFILTISEVFKEEENNIKQELSKRKCFWRDLNKW